MNHNLVTLLEFLGIVGGMYGIFTRGHQVIDACCKGTSAAAKGLYRAPIKACHHVKEKRAANPLGKATVLQEFYMGNVQPAVIKKRDVNKNTTLVLKFYVAQGIVQRRLYLWNKKKDHIRDLGDLRLPAGFKLEDDREIFAESMLDARKKLEEIYQPKPGQQQAAPKKTASSESLQDAAGKGAGADGAEKQKKSMKVWVGRFLQEGFMQRAIQDKVVKHFGVTIRDQSGNEDHAWGVDLKRALSEADVKVGDTIRITLIGKKVMEEGKNPMNCYSIERLAA
jgi:hypothetical protein